MNHSRLTVPEEPPTVEGTGVPSHPVTGEEPILGELDVERRKKTKETDKRLPMVHQEVGGPEEEEEEIRGDRSPPF